MTVDRASRIIGSAMSHQVTWNDNMPILYDEMSYSVNHGVIPDNFDIILYKRNEYVIVIDIPYKCVWFMMDNGYLVWSCTVPPVKDSMP